MKSYFLLFILLLSFYSCRSMPGRKEKASAVLSYAGENFSIHPDLQDCISRLAPAAILLKPVPAGYNRMILLRLENLLIRTGLQVVELQETGLVIDELRRQITNDFYSGAGDSGNIIGSWITAELIIYGEINVYPEDKSLSAPGKKNFYEGSLIIKYIDLYKNRLLGTFEICGIVPDKQITEQEMYNLVMELLANRWVKNFAIAAH